MKYAALGKLDISPLNYIGAFIAFSCNLSCSYCINNPDQSIQRSKTFNPIAMEMSPDDWLAGMDRIGTRDDLPITLQGGEPLLYDAQQGLETLFSLAQHHKFDILTNLALSNPKGLAILAEGRASLTRNSPYPSIRVSYHPDEMDRVWHGQGIEELVTRCLSLAQYGFRVTPEKAQSDVGIYMVDHPENAKAEEKARKITQGKVPFETKSFLGVYNNKLYGHYRYPFSTNLWHAFPGHPLLKCECRTSELLVDALGFVWRCHYYLYSGWVSKLSQNVFRDLQKNNYRMSSISEHLKNYPLIPSGHLLDPEFCVSCLREFRSCPYFGRCVGCDTKVKNNRFQSLDDWNVAHTSVEIRAIQMPATLAGKISDDVYRDHLVGSGIIGVISE
jgi:organic radical activating enzyme